MEDIYGWSKYYLLNVDKMGDLLDDGCVRFGDMSLNKSDIPNLVTEVSEGNSFSREQLIEFVECAKQGADDNKRFVEDFAREVIGAAGGSKLAAEEFGVESTGDATGRLLTELIPDFSVQQIFALEHVTPACDWIYANVVPGCDAERLAKAMLTYRPNPVFCLIEALDKSDEILGDMTQLYVNAFEEGELPAAARNCVAWCGYEDADGNWVDLSEHR